MKMVQVFHQEVGEDVATAALYVVDDEWEPDPAWTKFASFRLPTDPGSSEAAAAGAFGLIEMLGGLVEIDGEVLGSGDLG